MSKSPERITPGTFFKEYRRTLQKANIDQLIIERDEGRDIISVSRLASLAGIASITVGVVGSKISEATDKNHKVIRTVGSIGSKTALAGGLVSLTAGIAGEALGWKVIREAQEEVKRRSIQKNPNRK